METSQENSVAKQPESTDDARLKALRNYALAVYVLYLAGFVAGGLTTLIGFILALIKGPEARGTYLESHFRLQTRTFWWAVFWAVVGILLIFVGVGVIVLIVASAWLLYLWIKGLVRLLDGRPV